MFKELCMVGVMGVFATACVVGTDEFPNDCNSNKCDEVGVLFPTESTDPDVIEALELGLMSDAETTHSEIIFTDGQLNDWTLQVFQNTRKPEGPTFFVPHDSENDAFLTGAWAISQYGGHLIAWSCDESRTCSNGVDPNRYFSEENSRYVSTVMNFFESKDYPVFTLHNNADSHHSLGGQGAIYADLETPYADARGRYHSGDPDDLIIYADTEDHEYSPVFREFDEEFMYSDVNSIFEYITPENSLGGHMSTYVIQHVGMQYFNIEAEHGHFAEQKVLLEALMDILGIF